MVDTSSTYTEREPAVGAVYERRGINWLPLLLAAVVSFGLGWLAGDASDNNIAESPGYSTTPGTPYTESVPPSGLPSTTTPAPGTTTTPDTTVP